MDLTSVSVKKFLSHIQTKDALTCYLAEKLLQHARLHGKSLVVTWQTEIAAIHCVLEHLRSAQEEADTKLILHAIVAKERGATRLFIFA